MATLLADKYAARKAEVNERFEQLRGCAGKVGVSRPVEVLP